MPYSIKHPTTTKLYGSLIRIAANCQIMTYEMVSDVVDLPSYRLPFSARLGSISTDSWNRHGVVLSALVVRKHEGTPSPEFFDFLKTLMSVPDDEGLRLILWAELVRDVHKHYGHIMCNRFAVDLQ
jgi:hypothetical protein